MNFIDLIEILKIMPPRNMIYAHAVFEGNGDLETYFAIIEEPRFLKCLGKYPVLTVRTGLLYYNGVCLVPFMMRVDGNNDLLYESWLNYHSVGDIGKKSFRDLTKQDNIVFAFYDSFGNEVRKIGIKNNLKEQFQDFIEHIESLDVWSMSDFDRERNNLYRDYPTPLDLWNALEPGLY